MMTLEMRLAQAPWAEDGDPDDRLALRACLTAEGRLDDDAFLADPAPWTATRQHSGGSAHDLRLVRVDEAWALRARRGDDEPLWVLSGEMFRPGAIIGLRQPDGAELLFRIVAVDADA